MRSTNQQWQIQFQTHSRNSAIKACQILAQGLETAPPFLKVLITGSQDAGKSLIIDSILSALDHKLSPYHLSHRSLLEEAPCSAIGNYLSKAFQGHNHPFIAAFFRLSKNPKLELNVEQEREKAMALWGCNRLIEFETAFHKPHKDQEGCIIDISKSPITNHLDWNRSWTITVNPTLQTPEVQNALQHLEQYESQRRMRQQRSLG